jgi:hypothetical protein
MKRRECPVHSQDEQQNNPPLKVPKSTLPLSKSNDALVQLNDTVVSTTDDNDFNSPQQLSAYSVCASQSSTTANAPQSQLSSPQRCVNFGGANSFSLGGMNNPALSNNNNNNNNKNNSFPSQQTNQNQQFPHLVTPIKTIHEESSRLTDVHHGISNSTTASPKSESNLFGNGLATTTSSPNTNRSNDPLNGNPKPPTICDMPLFQNKIDPPKIFGIGSNGNNNNTFGGNANAFGGNTNAFGGNTNAFGSGNSFGGNTFGTFQSSGTFTSTLKDNPFNNSNPFGAAKNPFLPASSSSSLSLSSLKTSSPLPNPSDIPIVPAATATTTTATTTTPVQDDGNHADNKPQTSDDVISNSTPLTTQSKLITTTTTATATATTPPQTVIDVGVSSPIIAHTSSTSSTKAPATATTTTTATTPALTTSIFGSTTPSAFQTIGNPFSTFAANNPFANFAQTKPTDQNSTSNTSSAAAMIAANSTTFSSFSAFSNPMSTLNTTGSTGWSSIPTPLSTLANAATGDNGSGGHGGHNNNNDGNGGIGGGDDNDDDDDDGIKQANYIDKEVAKGLSKREQVLGEDGETTLITVQGKIFELLWVEDVIPSAQTQATFSTTGSMTKTDNDNNKNNNGQEKVIQQPVTLRQQRYVERGMAEIRINKNIEKDTARIIARHNTKGSLLLNENIYKSTSKLIPIDSDKKLRLTTITTDQNTKTQQIGTYLFLFKLADDGENFKNTFTQVQNELSSVPKLTPTGEKSVDTSENKSEEKAATE